MKLSSLGGAAAASRESPWVLVGEGQLLQDALSRSHAPSGRQIHTHTHTQHAALSPPPCLLSLSLSLKGDTPYYITTMSLLALYGIKIPASSGNTELQMGPKLHQYLAEPV